MYVYFFACSDQQFGMDKSACFDCRLGCFTASFFRGRISVEASVQLWSSTTPAAPEPPSADQIWPSSIWIAVPSGRYQVSSVTDVSAPQVRNVSFSTYCSIYYPIPLAIGLVHPTVFVIWKRELLAGKRISLPFSFMLLNFRTLMNYSVFRQFQCRQNLVPFFSGSWGNEIEVFRECGSIKYGLNIVYAVKRMIVRLPDSEHSDIARYLN